MGAELKQQQQDFIEFYFTPGTETFSNAYKSAVAAGYAEYTARFKAPGWVNKSKRKSGNKRIWDEAQLRRKDYEENAGISRFKTLAEYRKLAYVNPRDFYKPNGDLKNIHDMHPDVSAAIAGMDISVSTKPGTDEPEVVYVKKIKHADKKATLDSIVKVMGYAAPEKHEHTGKDGGPIETILTEVAGATRGLPNTAQGKIRE